MRKYIIGVVVGVLLSSAVFVLAGNPDSTAAPEVTKSFTLEDIYNRLDSGADGAQSTFTEPGVAPGTGTMHTLIDIMNKAPAKDDTNGATTGDVATGKTFWGLNVAGVEWGLRTGTAAAAACCTCSGTLVGTRWCDNGDGTVTDLLGSGGKGKCLVWLKDASWGGTKAWRENTVGGWDDAHTRAGLLEAADYAWLSDGSVEGDWRLPTKSELVALTTGTEAVSSGNMRAFTGVQSSFYWSSTPYTSEEDPDYAWSVLLSTGNVATYYKPNSHYVWPVRGGQ